MPPVMGAVAFVMADFLQVPYKEVAIAAILPSVLYYAALFIQCDLEAARYGFGKVEAATIPRIGRCWRSGWIFLAPFAVLVDTMFWLNWRAGVLGDGGSPRRSSSLWASSSATAARACSCGTSGARWSRPASACARSW